MSTALAIRDQVRALLSGGIDLDSFEDWFLSHTWNAHLHEDAPTVAAIHRIEGTLLDFSSDAIGLETLRKELANAIRPFVEPETQGVSTIALLAWQGVAPSLRVRQGVSIVSLLSPAVPSLKFTLGTEKGSSQELVAYVA